MSSHRIPRRTAIVMAIATCGLAYAAIPGDRAAPAAERVTGHAVGDLRPISPATAVAVVHLRYRSHGADRIVATAIRLEPGTRYVLALSRRRCSAVAAEPTQAPGKPLRAFTADEDGTASVDALTRSNVKRTDLRQARTFVLLDADGRGTACGLIETDMVEF